MTSVFAAELADTCETQWSNYHSVTEGDEPLSGQIKKYWTGLGLAFPGVQEQWSAVFVSWCLMTAGAAAGEFKFSQRHAIFVKWAIANAQAGTGLFRALRIDVHSPQIGDVVADNQPGHTYDFAYAAAHDSYHSHSAIVVERGHNSQGEYVRTVGGNEGNSVRKKIIYLHDGLIPQREHMPFIAIIQNRK